MKLKLFAVALLTLVVATFSSCKKSGVDAAKAFAENVEKAESADDCNALVDDYLDILNVCDELTGKALDGDEAATKELDAIQEELMKISPEKLANFQSKLSAENMNKVQSAAMKFAEKAYKMSSQAMEAAGNLQDEMMEEGFAGDDENVVDFIEVDDEDAE